MKLEKIMKLMNWAYVGLTRRYATTQTQNYSADTNYQTFCYGIGQQEPMNQTMIKMSNFKTKAINYFLDT